MNSTDKVKFVQDVVTEPDEYSARRPFSVTSDQRRRFVRLEISSPMTISKIKDVGGGFWPESNWHLINGMILNISAGGVLVEVDQPLLDGDVVSMHFTVQDVESLDNVLGLVKRVDQDGASFLAGIQFMTRERLNDVFSQGEMDLLSESVTSFNDSIRSVLNRYIYGQRAESRE